MEFHQLRYFLAIVETGGFSRAAERMRVAQPSLSQQIQKLEEEVGRPLFDRLPRGVNLTETGRKLLPHARRILAELSDMQRSVDDREDRVAGVVRLGVIPTIAPYILSSLLAAFSREYPLASLSISEDVTARLVELLESGGIDLAIVSTCRSGSGLQRETWANEPLVAVLPARHRLARRSVISLADMAGEPFQLLHETHCLSRQIGQWCRRCGVRPRHLPPVLQLSTIMALVAEGGRVSLVPSLAATAPPPAGCVFRPFRDPVPEREINVLWKPVRYRNQITVALAGVARKVIAEAVKAPVSF